MSAPIVLTPAFRRRLLALVGISSVLVAAAPPVIYHVQKRSELVAVARGDASRIASVVTASIQARPLLWRYDATKMSERLRVDGFGNLSIFVVHDAEGTRLPLDLGGKSPPTSLLWGQSDVVVGGVRKASVWVGTDATELYRATLLLACVSTLTAAILALLLYRVPLGAIRTAEGRIGALVDELSLSLREDERKRIARDLHDGASQALTAARLHLRALGKSIEGEAARERLDQAVSHIDEAIDEVRRSTTLVTPSLLGEVGLAEALQRHAESFGTAAGLDIRYERPARLPPLSPAIEVACLRIVQEALHNVVRHAQAKRAFVVLRASDDARTLLLTVRDDGRDAGGPEGNGLGSIRDRAASLGGAATFSSSDRGSRWDVEIPLR